ncbi:MAG: ribonuclease E inhibitor RraB [Colwellia sp.]|nr:ribonuclease E inhibitor RraB [Colwellia sp.]
MNRDLALFPEDNIGNALWQMMIDGDDLNQAREIEFSVLFSSEEAALKFGKLLLENNQKVSFSPYEDNADFPWEITAYPFVAASYENISSYQNLLESSAEPLAGQYDGFYCAAV